MSLREHVLFFRHFLRHPRTIGAVMASSRVLADAMVASVDFGAPSRIVELGPGTGAFTAAIVARLPPPAQFLAIDIEPEFVDQLRARWPHVPTICASAERLDRIVADRGLLPVDHIVSGLPFVSLPAAVTQRIVDNIGSVLRRGGTFTTFQYVHGYLFPSASAFRRAMTARMGAPPNRRLIARNVPTAFVLTWTKARD